MLIVARWSRTNIETLYMYYVDLHYCIVVLIYKHYT